VSELVLVSTAGAVVLVFAMIAAEIVPWTWYWVCAVPHGIETMGAVLVEFSIRCRRASTASTLAGAGAASLDARGAAGSSDDTAVQAAEMRS